jgi:two-component system, OmpR family, phosphate regulon response regulator PhoB
MTEAGTILLTSQRPELQAALADSMPGLGAFAIGSNPPQAQLASRIWCFVDWLLPDISGLEMCRRLRAAPATAHSHITMVLDEDDGDARRRALRAGADDYLIGPLTADLLLDRIHRHLPNSIGTMPLPKLVHGDLTLDLAAHVVRWQGKPLPLRPNEFRLLIHFVEHPDQVFSRTSLIQVLGKDAGAIDERTVDVWIGRLRRALTSHGVPDPLRTVRSMGYVLDGIA